MRCLMHSEWFAGSIESICAPEPRLLGADVEASDGERHVLLAADDCVDGEGGVALRQLRRHPDRLVERHAHVREICGRFALSVDHRGEAPLCAPGTQSRPFLDRYEEAPNSRDHPMWTLRSLAAPGDPV